MIRKAERDVTCIALLQRLSGFTVRLIQPITSFPLSSTIAAKALMVYPSEKVILKVPSPTQEIIPLMFPCLVMASPIAGIGEVDQRTSDERILRTVSMSCRTRLTRDINRFDMEQ